MRVPQLTMHKTAKSTKLGRRIPVLKIAVGKQFQNADIPESAVEH
jgi:hypothetical protein